MKSLPASHRAILISLLLAMVGFLAGCATTPKVDWTARMGEYTYDQAVNELGPPTKQTKSAEGKTIAEWIARTPTSTGYGASMGYGGVGMGVGNPYGSYRESVLRLTFGADGILENWYRNY